MQEMLDAAPIQQETGTLDHVVPVSTIISIAALLVSLGVGWWTVSHDPLGAGIDSYDLTTPEKALRAEFDILLNHDERALRELYSMNKLARFVKEQRETIKVHKDSNYQGKKILFVSFEENGLPKYDIKSFEKDAETGLWFPTQVSTYDMDDSSLEKAITEWRAQDGNDTLEEKFNEIRDALK